MKLNMRLLRIVGRLARDGGRQPGRAEVLRPCSTAYPKHDRPLVGVTLIWASVTNTLLHRFKAWNYLRTLRSDIGREDRSEVNQQPQRLIPKM